MHEIHSKPYLSARALQGLPSDVVSFTAEGVTDTAAAALYKKGKAPPVPSGRYGASSVAYDGKLWMFAGTDGGYSKHGNGGYELGKHLARGFSDSWHTFCNQLCICVCTVTHSLVDLR